MADTMFSSSHIWFEDAIPDYIRANIVTTPGPAIIRSATSNYQRSPKWLVLLDGKYQVSQLQNVSVTRSRTIASNTATITIINVDNRYSGPNKTKIAVNIPISIFFGFENEYLQHYEGYIDTTSMTTNAQGSTITIQCRDKAKQFLEQKISAGVFAGPPEDDAWDYTGHGGVALDDGYLGYQDWHYTPRWDADGNLLRYPKTWTSKEVLLDICYRMGLKDLGEYVYVTKHELPSGDFAYERHIRYQSDFDLQISPDMDTPLVTNFVEMPPLDCIAKVSQAILHEAVFDVDGRLIVRPVKTSKDPSVFYMKEERDIASITEDVDDDRLVNICTVIGQTSKESAVIYPFAPVSVVEKVTLDKGQDLYSWSVTYPKIVSSENAKTVLKANVWAPVIHPYGQLFPNPINNPENRPQFDTRTYFPTFASPYEKGEVLTGSCAIVTDTADWAPRGNKRKMWFFGALEEAIQFEFQPIMLKDRFGKTVRVVCRERAYPGTGPDDESGVWQWIEQCGNTPFVPDITRPDPGEDEPEPVPAELYGLDGTVDASGRLTVVELENVPTESFTPIYGGLSLGSGSYMLVGWVSETGLLPSTAPTPEGIDPSDISTLYGINMMMARQVSPGEPYKDSFGNHRTVRNMVFYHCSKRITVNTYRPPSGSEAPVQVCITDVSDFKDTENAVVISTYINNPNDYTVGCTVAQDPNDTTGQYHIVLPYADQAPPGWVLSAQEDVIIQYPVVVYSTSPTQFGTVGEWHYVIWDTYLLSMNNTISSCAGMRLVVAGGRIPVWMAQSGDPDTNCIYWMWNGGYKRFNNGRDDTTFRPEVDYDVSEHPITFNDGEDWNGAGRALIHRDLFYKYAQDPNTTIVELTTDGLDGKSSAEIIEFTENYIVSFGHNYYGNMEAEFRQMADEIERMMEYIGAALVLLSVAMMVASRPQPVTTTGGSGFSSGTEAGAMVASLGIALGFLVGLAMIFMGIGAGNGRNISKVMENLNVRVTGVRREEIHLYQNSSQQASWWITDGMDHETGQWHTQTGNMQYRMFPFEDDIGYGWVFVMDLTKQGDASIPFPDGCYVTSFLWETPEIGDRNIIDYYETQPVRLERSYRFKVEGYGNDEINGYSAEYLLNKRFSAQDITDPWYESYGYEVLVDRSLDDVSVTDTGLGWHFFERREDYQPRIYKYVSLTVYSAKETRYSNTDVDVMLTTVEHVVPGSSPQQNQVFATATPAQSAPDEVVTPAYVLPGYPRWGMIVIRGLNPAWYAKYRWLEDKTEQNYARFKVLHAGQDRMSAHIYNNTRFSTVTMDIRIWGKAYGKFAPTIVYYHESNLLSIWSYGLRQLTLTNDCINDYNRARYIARKLACASNVAYKMRVTGKGFLKEGDIITVKEETTGALAGTFRVWENTFLSPAYKPCTVPANQLLSQEIEGVYEPRVAVPSTNNNVMIACGGNGKPTYVIELDAASNPVWYAKAGAPYEPGFVLRIDGPGSIASVIGGGAPLHQVRTIVGVRETQDVVVLDYAVALPLEHYFVNAPILCGCTDEQQRYLWVGTEAGITCIDLQAQQAVYIANIGPVHGIAAVNNQVWDAQLREDVYKDCGCIFVAQTNGIHAYQNWSDGRTKLGPRLATFANIPTGNPMSLTYAKSLNELVYVNGHTLEKNGTIHGVNVQVDYDVDHPEDGVIVTFPEELWQLDYFEDAEIKHQIPNETQRREYIAEFFQPVHAERDVNNELVVTDNANNRVYKINPTGKFYITEITTSIDVSNNSTSYMHDISAIVVENAVSTMLTNFGQNFLQEKTDEQIEAQSAVGMGAIRKIMPKGKYRVQLLGSTTYVTAYNNSNDDALRVGDTVLVSYGFGQKNMCAIIGRKPLNDWTVETGEPYTTVDATTIDVTKYGQSVAEGQNNQSGSSTDLTTVYAQLREMRNEINMLKGLHGV